MIENHSLPILAFVVMAESEANNKISLNSFVSEISSDIQ